MVLQRLKLPIRAAVGRRNVQDYRFSALRVWVNEYTLTLSVHSLTQSVLTHCPWRAIPTNMLTLFPLIIQQSHNSPLLSHLSRTQQTERFLIFPTIYVTLIQLRITHSHPSRKEKAAQKCTDCCVSHSSCCRALTIRLTQEMSQGDPGSKSLVRHQP